MRKKTWCYYIVFIVTLSLSTCAVKPSVKPISKIITIFYISRLNLNNIARISTIVKQEKTKHPVLFLINGKIFSESPLTTLWQGEAEISILNQAGVDAIVITPDFLRFGSQRAQALINQGDFFFLAANLTLTRQASPFTAKYLIRNFAKTKVSIFGLLVDSINPYLKLSAIEWKDLIYTQKLLTPLLRLNSDLVGVAVSETDSLLLSDVDFVIGAKNAKSIAAPSIDNDSVINQLDLMLSDNSRLIDYRYATVPITDTIREDSLVKMTMQRYEIMTDSILDTKIINSEKDLKREDLLVIITQAVLNETKADGFIVTNSIDLKPIPKGVITYRKLIDAFGFTQNLLMIKLNGEEAKSLSDQNYTVGLSAPRKKSKFVAQQNYWFVTTPDFFNSKIALSGKELTVTDSSLISMVVKYLKKARKIETR